MNSDDGIILFSSKAKPQKQINTTVKKEEKKKEAIEDDEPKLKAFNKMGLKDWIIKAINRMEIRKPTDVQFYCIPKILEGRSVVARSQTGTGKTAAFALPILQTLFDDPYGIYALVLTPVRELAIQICDQFDVFGDNMGTRICQIIGGTDVVNQSIEIQSRPHIVVATPGRLYEHIKDNSKLFKSLKYLVLDEVDRLLTPSLYPKVREILDLLPKNRIELLFSATISPAVEEYTKTYLQNPFIYNATKTDTVVNTIEQMYLFIPEQVKLCYLIYLIKNYGPYILQDVEEKDSRKKNNKKTKKDRGKEDKHQNINPECGSIIIFTSTVKQAQLVHEVLDVMNIDNVVMHSVLNQRRRLASLGKFKAQISRVLVATDVASRGLDIPTVDLVINYDIPRDPRDYIHRIGRTGRIGKLGKSISLITQYDIQLIHQIEKHIGSELVKMEDIEESKVMLLINKVNRSETEANQRMIDYGFLDEYEQWQKRNGKGKRKNENKEGTESNKKRKTEEPVEPTE